MSDGLRRSLVTRRQCHCRAARRRHDTDGATSKGGTVTVDIEAPWCQRPWAIDIDGSASDRSGRPCRGSSRRRRGLVPSGRACHRGHQVSDLRIDIVSGAALVPGCADIGATDSPDGGHGQDHARAVVSSRTS